MRFHQARVGKTANSLLKNSAKIHLKNERKIIRQTPPKSWANVRSKSRPKRGPKGTSKSKKSRKTSKSEIENWPKKGQKWTSKTAPKMHPKIQLKIDHKSAWNRLQGENRPRFKTSLLEIEVKCNFCKLLQNWVEGYWGTGARCARIGEIWGSVWNWRRS